MNKYKKNNQHKAGISRNQGPTFSLSRRNAIQILVILVIIYAVITDVSSVGFLSITYGQPLRIEESPNQTEDTVLLPVIKRLSTKQDIIDLKKEEIELVRELLKNFPDSHESLTITGNLYHRHGDSIEAQKFWDESLKINPNQADVYNNIGWLYMKKGDFENAIAQFRKALKVDPKFPDVHSNIGHALMISGRPEEAIADLKEELRISPKSDFANFLLGQVHMQLKEYQKAKQYYETTIKITPEYVSAYYGLSTACSKLGDSDKAKEYSESFKKLKAQERKSLKGRKIKYDDFVETQKSAAITYISVGRMYRENGNLTRAEELLKQAAGLDPENVVCFLELATLYQLSNQPSKTLQMYKKISEIQPESSLPYFVIGMLSAQLKQYDDSEKAFRRLIALVPNKSDAYRELARVYLKTNKNLPQARQLAEKAVAIKASADNYYILSWAFYSNGEIVRALAAIQHALKLDPSNKQYMLLYEHIQQRK